MGPWHYSEKAGRQVLDRGLANLTFRNLADFMREWGVSTRGEGREGVAKE